MTLSGIPDFLGVEGTIAKTEGSEPAPVPACCARRYVCSEGRLLRVIIHQDEDRLVLTCVVSGDSNDFVIHVIPDPGMLTVSASSISGCQPAPGMAELGPSDPFCLFHELSVKGFEDPGRSRSGSLGHYF